MSTKHIEMSKYLKVDEYYLCLVMVHGFQVLFEKHRKW